MTYRMAPWAGLALAAVAAAPAHAQDRRAQYRELQLADGRDIVAEIIATEATGLRLRTPQGETMLSFELLRDMSPADADSYKLQEAWYVYVAAPDAHRDRLMEAFRWIPSTRVQLAGDVVPGMGPAAAAAAAKCKQDFPCLLEATKDAPWMHVVSVKVEKEGPLEVVSGLNTGPTRTRITKPDHGPEELWEAVHQALFLEVPDGGPPESAFASTASGEDGGEGPVVLPDGPTQPPADANLIALSFTGVPGLPASKQKNGGGVAAALLVTGLGTAAWVGAVGHTAQSAPELAGLSVVGFYATSVFANQITIKR